MIPANREKWRTNKWVDFAQDDGWGLTSPVGTYPRGATKHGVLDMAGNLWEWTGTLNEGLKEVRGGSWSSNWIGVRTSFRGKNEPNSRFDDIGVRCVMER